MCIFLSTLRGIERNRGTVIEIGRFHFCSSIRFLFVFLFYSLTISRRHRVVDGAKEIDREPAGGDETMCRSLPARSLMSVEMTSVTETSSSLVSLRDENLTGSSYSTHC